MDSDPAPATRDEDHAPLEKGHGMRMALVVVGLAAGFALFPRMTRSCAPAATETDAPDFTASFVANAPEDQKEMTLSAYRGHPVLLDFWATWCGPCQAESPIMNSISQRFKDRGLVVVGVNTSDEPGLAEAFVRRKKLSFPMVFDEHNRIANQFRAETLPTLVVISKTGKIVAVRHGLTSETDLERIVRGVL